MNPKTRLPYVTKTTPDCELCDAFGPRGSTFGRPPSGVIGGYFLSFFGGVSYRIRILMYFDVSCMYPDGHMYPLCILMYLKCNILNALLHIFPREYMYLDLFCMYFTRIPNESKIHFGIHMRYVKIHVSCTWDTIHSRGLSWFPYGTEPSRARGGFRG